MAGVFQNMMTNVDGALVTLSANAAAGMSGYVMPLAWVVFGLSMLIWCYFVISGRVELNVSQGVSSVIFILIVLYMASGGYQTLIAGPLYALPTQLASALSGGNPVSILDDLFIKFVNLISGILKAMIDQATSFSIGGTLALFMAAIVVLVIACLLLAGAMFVLLYSKIGLSLVLGVGPFFMIWLAWQPTRQQFYPWLNTALYLTFLYVLTHLFITLFIGIVDVYMTKLAETIGSDTPTGIAAVLSGASAVLGLNVMTVVMQLAVISLPMFFILLQLPTIAQSLTAAGAGSFGSGLTGIANQVRHLSSGR